MHFHQASAFRTNRFPVRYAVTTGVCLCLVLLTARCTSSDVADSASSETQAQTQPAQSDTSSEASMATQTSSTQRGGSPEGDTLDVVAPAPPHAAPTAGFNANWLALPSRDGRMLDTLRTFQPELIRFPGGTVSDYWNWRDGWVDASALPERHQPWKRIYNQRPQTLDQLQRVVEHVGAEPVFVLNMISASIDDQLAMLRAAASMGMPVRYVELGNEYYFEKSEYLEAFPRAESYASTARAWMKQIRAEFPDAAVAPIATFIRPGLSTRRTQWNKAVADGAPERDGVAFHPYHSMQLHDKAFASGSDSLQAYGDRTASAYQIKQQRGFQDFPSDSLWITEYNAGAEKALRDTWIRGLIEAAYGSLLIQEPRVRMLLAHEINGSAQDARAIKTQEWGQQYAVTTYGTALRMLFRALHDVSSVQPLQLESEETVEAGRSSHPGIVANRYGESTAVLVNTGADSLVLNVEAVFGDQSLRYEVVSHPSPLQNGVMDADLDRRTGNAQHTVIMHPFSLMRLKMAPEER